MNSAAMYVIKFPAILHYFCILFYVTWSRYDRVAVFSFRIAGITWGMICQICNTYCKSYAIKLHGTLPFFCILFYVIWSRSDRVTVLSFRIANMTCSNDISNDVHQGLSEPVLGFRQSKQVQTILGTHNRLVITFGLYKDFYVALLILVQMTWFFLQYALLICRIILK
jgi:hypothetical protein